LIILIAKYSLVGPFFLTSLTVPKFPFPSESMISKSSKW
jgi:hypothetical protein